jgi:uncharacterized protein
VAAYFFDSSAIVKRYVAETGSAWVGEILNPAARHRIYIARISIVEVTAAVARRQRDGSLSAEAASSLIERFDEDCGGAYRIVEMTALVLELAAELAASLGLRAYDAVQLGAALTLHRRRVAARHGGLTLVSSDTELNAGAISAGLAVEDPNMHG